MSRNLVSLKAKSGPDFERWLQGIARGIVRASRRAKPPESAAEET